MTNDEGNPKPECRKTLSRAVAGFVIRICAEWFLASEPALWSGESLKHISSLKAGDGLAIV